LFLQILIEILANAAKSLQNMLRPYVLAAFHLNCLSDNLLKVIPGSAGFYWRHRDMENNSFGYEWSQENKRLFDTIVLFLTGPLFEYSLRLPFFML
jgi:hypothetical protein